MPAADLSLIALTLYFGAHAFRCVRLYTLSLGERKGGARLVATHCLTVWANAVIPFKLGEILRIAGFGIAMRSASAGAGIWLIERFSDAVAILVLVGGASLLLPEMEGTATTLGIAATFIVICCFVAWVMIETVPFLHADLVLRSRSRKGFLALQIVNQAEQSIEQARRLLVGRFSLTVLLGLIIWTLDLGAIVLWSLSAGTGAELAHTFLLGGQEPAQTLRLPVFIAFTAIGFVFLGGIALQLRRLKHV